MHNLPFYARMLANEYARLARSSPSSVCTLSQCTPKHIPLSHYSSGPCQAEGPTAILALAVARDSWRVSARDPGGLLSTAFSRTLGETLSPPGWQMPFLARLAALTAHRQARGASLVYLDLLDRVLQ